MRGKVLHLQKRHLLLLALCRLLGLLLLRLLLRFLLVGLGLRSVCLCFQPCPLKFCFLHLGFSDQVLNLTFQIPNLGVDHRHRELGHLGERSGGLLRQLLVSPLLHLRNFFSSCSSSFSLNSFSSSAAFSFFSLDARRNV